MKLEIGKFYKTRGGHKVRIYATDGPKTSAAAVHGAVLCDGVWHAKTWGIDGRYVRSTGDHYEDIIAEWHEPKLRPWKPEEVPVGAHFKHVGHDHINGSGRIYTTLVIASCGVLFATYGENVTVTPEELCTGYLYTIDNGKTWLPCGVEE